MDTKWKQEIKKQLPIRNELFFVMPKAGVEPALP